MTIFVVYVLLFTMTYKITGTITVEIFFIILIVPVALYLTISSMVRSSRISNLKKYIASVDCISMHSVWFSSSGKNAIAIDDDRKLITTFDKFDRDYQHETITYSSVISAELSFNNRMIAKIRRETDIPIHTRQEEHDTTCTNSIIYQNPISFFKKEHDLELSLKLTNTKTSLYTILLYRSNDHRQVKDVIQETEQMVSKLHATIHPSCQYTKIILLKESTSATKESTQTPTKSISNPPPAPAKPLLVDINRAGEYEIARLPGISIIQAKHAVTFRGSQRDFLSVDDFAVIIGLNRKFIKQIRPHIFTRFPNTNNNKYNKNTGKNNNSSRTLYNNTHDDSYDDSDSSSDNSSDNSSEAGSNAND